MINNKIKILKQAKHNLLLYKNSKKYFSSNNHQDYIFNKIKILYKILRNLLPLKPQVILQLKNIQEIRIFML